MATDLFLARFTMVARRARREEKNRYIEFQWQTSLKVIYKYIEELRGERSINHRIGF